MPDCIKCIGLLRFPQPSNPQILLSLKSIGDLRVLWVLSSPKEVLVVEVSSPKTSLDNYVSIFGGARMFALNRCTRLIACVAAFGMVASPVLGASPMVKKAGQASSTTFDVKTINGQLTGQVMTAAGTPEGGVQVSLLSAKSLAGKTVTDKQGRFALPVDASGAYRVAVGKRSFDVRAWQPEAAPPSAKDGLLCVTKQVVRGQCGGCGAVGPCGCGAPMAAPSCGVSAPCGPCGGMGGFGGGMGGGGIGSILRNPAVIGLGVAAAIALPIALDDDDDDDGVANNGGTGAGGSGEPAS